jgi:hypothetical protein
VPTDQTPGEEELSPTHRLFGIFVKEVSLVDRAANKRKFLVTKRDPMPKANVTKAATPKTPAAKTAAPAAVAKGPEQGAAETAGDTAGQTPGGGPDGAGAPAQSGAPAEGALPAMQPQAKDQLLSAITGLASKLVDVADMVKDAPTDEKATGPAVPESVLGSLKEIGTALQGMLAQYAGGGDASAEGAAPAEAAKDLDGVTENGGVTAQGTQKAKDPEPGKDEEAVEKAGRKMAKERLNRLSQILSALSGIYRELNADKTAKGATAPVTKNAKVEAGEVVELAKADLDTMLLTVDEAARRIEAAEAQVKKLTADNAELRKSVGAPNSVGPGEIAKARSSSATVAWPLDMNAPVKKTPDFGSAAARRQ